MISIPNDVTEYLRNHFAQCNNDVALGLSNHPGMYEESLDMTLINYWAPRQAPMMFASNWIVKVDINFMGHGRHIGAYEAADIGIVLIFRKQGKVVRSKMAFLQSKKLYASPLVKKSTRYEEYGYGMGNLLLPEEAYGEIIKPIKYTYSDKSNYEALQKDNEQQLTMKAFQDRYNMKMYYLFYNPIKIPLEVVSPLEVPLQYTLNEIGCRIMPKDSVDEAISSFSKGYTPTFGDIKYMLPLNFYEQHSAGWRLEHFIVDLMMGCKEGVIDDSPSFEYLKNFMNLKRRPMAASLAITFDIRE